MRKNIYAVILAGGSGTRFWPLSRKDNPKQFLQINGPDSLLQLTVKRIKQKILPENILIVTNKQYKKKVMEQMASFKVPAKNIMLEPEGKNTAPAICWAAARIYSQDKDSVMVVLPSDHLIRNKEAYMKILDCSFLLAKENFLVAMGIVPTRPETGYGYLRTKSIRHKGKNVCKVMQFTEKPSLAKAKQYLKQKNYFWNSGMFVWRCDAILDAFQEYLPSVYRCFEKGHDIAHINRVWRKLPNISIDYGILEKAENVVAVSAARIEWSDLGSWESLADISAKDKKGNTFKGDVLDICSQHTYVLSDMQKQKRLVATIGLDNIIVVDTGDALLICRKDKSQEVKKVVEILQKKRRPELFSKEK